MFYKKAILSISVGVFYFITTSIYLNRAVIDCEVVLKTHERQLYNAGFKKSIFLELKGNLSNIEFATLTRSYVTVNATNVPIGAKGQYIYINIKSMFYPKSFFSITDINRLSDSVKTVVHKALLESIFHDDYKILKVNEISRSDYLSSSFGIAKLLFYSLIISIMVFVFSLFLPSRNRLDER